MLVFICKSTLYLLRYILCIIYIVLYISPGYAVTWVWTPPGLDLVDIPIWVAQKWCILVGPKNALKWEWCILVDIFSSCHHLPRLSILFPQIVMHANKRHDLTFYAVHYLWNITFWSSVHNDHMVRTHAVILKNFSQLANHIAHLGFLVPHVANIGNFCNLSSYLF